MPTAHRLASGQANDKDAHLGVRPLRASKRPSLHLAARCRSFRCLPCLVRRHLPPPDLPKPPYTHSSTSPSWARSGQDNHQAASAARRAIIQNTSAPKGAPSRMLAISGQNAGNIAIGISAIARSASAKTAITSIATANPANINAAREIGPKRRNIANKSHAIIAASRKLGPATAAINVVT